MKITPILTALAFAAVLSSCNHASRELPVPKGVSMVVHISGSSLTSKLSWKEIQETDWFKEMYKKAGNDTLQKRIMDDPGNSGIDIKSDFAFFMKKQGKGGYMVFEGNLKNSAEFERMIKKMNPNDPVQNVEGFSYIKTGSGDMTSWNDSKFIFMADAPTVGNSPYGSENMDNSFPVDSLKKFTADLFSLKSSNSMASDKRYTSLMNEPGDMHYYMNMEQYYDGMTSAMSAMDNTTIATLMSAMNKLFKGNVSTGILNFDDGKISFKTKQYLGEDMARVFNKYKLEPVSLDMVNRIPSQNVVGAMVTNYPPEAMKDMLKVTGLDGLANVFLTKFNYSLDELMQASKGQMVFAVTDFNRTQTTETMPGTGYQYPSTKTDAKILFGLSVNNKGSFDKLIDLATTELKKQDPEAYDKAMSHVNYKVSNDWFAVSNYPETVDQFMAGGNNNLSFASKISGHPMGIYVDIQKILQGFKPEASSIPGIYDASMNMWQDVVITGGDYKDGVSTGEFTINLVDKKTNSLKQINRYTQEMYDAQKKREEAMMQQYQNLPTDSAVEAAPAN